MERLMLFELGPVVQIIAAARKTRDMWYGSWMLSEVAKAAAKKVADQFGFKALIAPAPADESELRDFRFAMGDEILVLLPTLDKDGNAVDPSTVAKLARDAAHKKWLEFADEAKKEISSEAINADRWAGQTNPELADAVCGEVVELVAVWCDWQSGDDYAAALRHLKRLMLGRTACRNFPTGSIEPGVPKSSLDGRRDTVLQKTARTDDSSGQPRRLRLNGNEHLDALGITKRVGGRSASGQRKNYPSTARLAADPWIRGLRQVDADLADELRHVADELADPKLTGSGEDPVLGKVVTNPAEYPAYPQFKPFPFEGAVLYESRHHEFVRETAIDTSVLKPLQQTLKRCVRAMVAAGRGEPGPYYAVLVADGDGIGAAIRQCQSPDDHREFSQLLSKFAGEVRQIVDDHNGALVFAAGEDITAFVPLDAVVTCSDALRQKFAEVVGATGQDVSLSVGAAIGHFRDPLDSTLSAARNMEGHAKAHPGKNALAIELRTRGGAPIKCRYGWNTSPLQTFADWAELLTSGRLSHKVAYDVNGLASFYADWWQRVEKLKEGSEKDRQLQLCSRAMQADCLRLLQAKSNTSRDVFEPLVGAITTPADLRNLAESVIIAWKIGTAGRQATPHEQATVEAQA